MGRQGAGGRGVDTVYWEEDPPVLRIDISGGGVNFDALFHQIIFVIK